MRAAAMNFLAELVGDSPGIVDLRRTVERLLHGQFDGRRLPPLLIQGETGTGKGLLARGMHRASPRGRGPFVDVNCAAIPETMLEAEMFGFERGAFTDARMAKPGLFQTAHRGTLFLDEIGLLSPALQAKLLNVVEERAVRRLGATRSEPVDVWVISATNEDLADAIREQRFREDLYHRLAVVTLSLPPLRDRGDDVLLLAEHFLARACADYGLSPKRLAEDARAALSAYPWPGNVRELSNVIERAALLTDTPLLTSAHLALPAPSQRRNVTVPAAIPTPPPTSAREAMRQQLEQVLAETGWNISRTAAVLGITRNTVKSRITRLGLREPSGAVTGARVEDEPRTPSRVRVGAPTAGHWEPRRLTLVRICLATAGGGEVDSRSARQLDAATDKICGFGGRIEGLSPGVLLAVFGIEPQDEPAVHAGHSALVIRNAAREIWPEAGDAIPIKIGLHTAEMFVRAGSGSPQLDADGSRREWTRLETAMEHAEPGAIVATKTAAELLRRRFTLVSVDPDAAVYRIEGLWRADSSVRSELGPFIGRREELALLESRLAAAVEGRGQVIDIAGEAGIGKSRLLLELAASPRMEAMPYLEGRCLPAETQTPFYPLLQIIRAACGIAEVEPASTIDEKLHRTLAETGSNVTEVAPEIAYLLGTALDPPEAPGPALTKRLFTAIQRLLLALASRRPLLIVVEDLHWIDRTSESCLAAIVESVAQAPILLVVTFRTGCRPSWSAGSQVLELTLAPMSAEDSVALIRGVLDRGSWSPTLEQDIRTRAEGNPLFLEELSRAARERSDGSLPERIPATVEDTIATRLAGLHPRQRRLLAMASVIGRDASLRLLSAVAELKEGALEAAIGHLRHANFLHESGLGTAEARYTFKHALVQETAYITLAPSERRALHVRVLDAIEKLYPERLADQVERLAHHAVLGEAYGRAVSYLLQAGEKAVARSALTEAISHLGKGLELIQKIPKTPECDRCELGLQLAMGLSLGATKGWAAPETEPPFARAREIAQQLEDVSQLGPVLVGQWVSKLAKAQYDTARGLAEELFALAERDPDPLIGAVAHRALGMTALYRGEFAAVRTHLERGLALYHPEADHPRAVHDYGGDPHVSCLAYLGRALWCLGYPDQALARNREAIAQARVGGGALSIATALGMLTSVHQLRGDVRETLEASEKAVAHAGEWGVTYWLAQATVLRTWAQAKSRSTLEPSAIDGLTWKSLEEYQRATGTTLGLTWFLTLLAETYGADGQPLEGLVALDEALAHADKSGERYHEAEIRRLKGELLLMRGGAGAVATAEAHFRRALEVARTQQAKGWELRVATSLARLLREQDGAREARALLAPVYESFTEGFETVDLQTARALLDAIDRRA